MMLSEGSEGYVSRHAGLLYNNLDGMNSEIHDDEEEEDMDSIEQEMMLAGGRRSEQHQYLIDLGIDPAMIESDPDLA